MLRKMLFIAAAAVACLFSQRVSAQCVGVRKDVRLTSATKQPAASIPSQGRGAPHIAKGQPVFISLKDGSQSQTLAAEPPAESSSPTVRPAAFIADAEPQQYRWEVRCIGGVCQWVQVPVQASGKTAAVAKDSTGVRATAMTACGVFARQPVRGAVGAPVRFFRERQPVRRLFQARPLRGMLFRGGCCG